MITTNKYYNQLIELKNDNPALTFNNIGYQYLSKEAREQHKEQIKEISNILKETIKGFVKFNNFKPRKEGGFCVRVQYKWDASFTGVGYFNINDFKDFEINN